MSCVRHVCVWVHVCAGTRVRRPEADASVFLNCSPPYILRQDLSGKPRACRLARLPSQVASLSLPLYPPGIYVGSAGLDSGSHAWAAGILPSGYLSGLRTFKDEPLCSLWGSNNRDPGLQEYLGLKIVSPSPRAVREFLCMVR